MEAYSILMSVYAKEDPLHFDAAIQSMLDQTVRTDDFVIVCDGPLTKELDLMLDRYQQENPGLFNLVRLPQNVGIGAAANAGLKVCKNDLIAKMDADDISVPGRCRMQLECFEKNPELVIVGGNIAEFEKDPDEPFSIRSVPQTNEEIRRFARRRQPFNNQTVMYRRHSVIRVGGYSSLKRNEDYDLYVRLLKDGCYAENIHQTLVKVRVDAQAQRRRASFATLSGCVRSRWRACRIGYSSLGDFLYCVVGQFVVFACPGKVQNLIYSRLFRKDCRKKEMSR